MWVPLPSHEYLKLLIKYHWFRGVRYKMTRLFKDVRRQTANDAGCLVWQENREENKKTKENWKNVFARHFGVQANLSVFFLVCLLAVRISLLHLTAVIIYIYWSRSKQARFGTPRWVAVWFFALLVLCRHQLESGSAHLCFKLVLLLYFSSWRTSRECHCNCY